MALLASCPGSSHGAFAPGWSSRGTRASPTTGECHPTARSTSRRGPIGPGRQDDGPLDEGKCVMHLRKHSPRYERTDDSDSAGTDAYRAACSCGSWEHHRRVDADNPLDRAEVEDAWFEHVNPGVRM